jgi:hypothetical protein
LNKFHADIAQDVLVASGYSLDDEADAKLIVRVKELLLKKTLNRAPLPRAEELKGALHIFYFYLLARCRCRSHSYFSQSRDWPFSLLSPSLPPHPSRCKSTPHDTDPESHLFEDAVCLSFLRLEFIKFSEPYLSSSSTPPTTHVNPDKLHGIIARTWAKMTPNGRALVVEELVGILPEELKKVTLEAVGTVKDAWEQ